MKPIKDFLAAIKTSASELRTKVNSALEKFKPLDQQELGREASYALNTLEWAYNACEEIGNRIAEQEAKLDESVAAAVAAEIAAKVESGELVTKTTSDAAVAAAEAKGKADAEAVFTAREEEAKTIAARRKEIEKAHGKEIAAAMSDESLKGEGFEEVKKETKRRVEALASIGINAKNKPDVLASVACGDDFSDPAAFDKSFATIKNLVPAGGKFVQTAASLPGSGQPPATGAAHTPSSASGQEEEEEEKVVYGF